MIAWVRRVIGRPTPPLVAMAAPPPSTRAELERTRPRHVAALRKADRVVQDYEKLDGVLRVYVRHSR